ncbi:MAG: AAA family ATPase [Ilumatobacteraceae bacterium]
MRLSRARVTNYRSVRDSGWFEVEHGKTILVGPNEAGKSALLRALQQIRAPKGIPGFHPLRDYPRSDYNDISTGRVDPARVTVVEAHFDLEAQDLDEVGQEYAGATYIFGRNLDNSAWHRFENGVERTLYNEVEKDLARLALHFDRASESSPAAANLSEIVGGLSPKSSLPDKVAKELEQWLDKNLSNLDESNDAEDQRYDRLKASFQASLGISAALNTLQGRLPLFVLFDNYFRVRPRIHLRHLADRLDSNILDDELYDYGNLCLLRLLGFSARQLADLGDAGNPAPDNTVAVQTYQDQLDTRSYQLNAASVRLTEEIKRVWNPDMTKDEASRLRVQADGQYLKVVVEDDLGVEVELDQRSEGFQWLVSFFVVFFAEATGDHANAVLLLDEPGMSLHGLKQREFRTTLSRLAEANQTIYTTHSPFLVGPDELDLVRVVEMTDRTVGTKVHETVTAGDPGALLPLQEALGYDLAQSLFAQERNLILEGLTDYWYIEGLSELLAGSGKQSIDPRIALVPASSAGKVTYFATILHAHHLKVAALLDSDAAGEAAANQDTLVHTLGNKRILRTKDHYSGGVTEPEIEDLLRHTLLGIANEIWSVDGTELAATQSTRRIADVLTEAIPGFSKYRLAKAFLRWGRDHSADDLDVTELEQAESLIATINKVLK